MKKAFLLYVLLHLSWSFSQITFYQDIFKGGVTGDALDPWSLPVGGSFEIYIEPGSTIRKAYLFISVYFTPNEEILLFNNTPIVLNPENTFDNDYYYGNNNNIRRVRTLMLDITNLIQTSQNIYSVSALTQSSSLLPGIYCEYYLYVAYENPTLPEICTNVFVNNIQPNANMLYFFNNLNPIITTQNVGLAINSSHMCDTIEDGSFVIVNSESIGLIGGQDDGGLGICSGATGTFYYQNSTLNGLGNDVANITMNGTDAIANIETYLNSTTSLDLEFIYQSNLGPKTNPVNQIFLTYTSPCSEFPTQTSSDTTLCFGTTAQLFASGGGSTGSAPAYEWQPAVGLSCTDCPNPIVTADSSRLYTVRIRNNDSCSVVRPIKVNVKPLPEFSSVVSKPSICGGAIGQILLGADYVGETYSINGGTPQTSGTFSNLSAGTYTVSLHELNGCTRDTLVVVGDTSLTQAYFTATPQSGAAPLWVQFSNQSTIANEFSWSVNGEPQGGNLSSFSFDTNGVYTVELVAWQFDPSCADTFSVLISVYDSLVVQIPNVFTPNHDGNNDFFGVTVNRPCAISFSILNRWGNVIQAGTVPTLGGFVPLWSGSNAPDGTYFYQIELQADDLKQVEKRQGFVELR